MNFKPTKKKIILSIILAAVCFGLFYYVNSISVRCFCEMKITENYPYEEPCEDFEHLSPIPDMCHCDCTTLGNALFEYVYTIIAPFVVAYALLSILDV